MNIGNLLTICIVCFYINYFLFLIFVKSKRNNIIKQNKELEKLRLIQNKTLEEQKKFIDLKMPKSGKWKFSWKWLLYLILQIMIYLVIFFTIKNIFIYLNINLSLAWGITFLIGIPIILNFLLKKINLNSNS